MYLMFIFHDSMNSLNLDCVYNWYMILALENVMENIVDCEAIDLSELEPDTSQFSSQTNLSDHDVAFMAQLLAKRKRHPEQTKIEKVK